MALRRKTSLKRDTDSDMERGLQKPLESAPQKSKRSSSLRPRKPLQAPITLVTKDPRIADFLDTTTQHLAPPPAKEVVLSETAVKVGSAMEALGHLESAVIAALFPSDGSAPQSLEEIATKLGMTLEEVKSLADNALRGLRGSRRANPRISTVWN